MVLPRRPEHPSRHHRRRDRHPAGAQHAEARADPVARPHAAHGAGDPHLLLLRLVPVALPQLAAAVLQEQLQPRDQELGAVRLRRLLRRRRRRHARRRDLRRDPQSGRATCAWPVSASPLSASSAPCCRCCRSSFVHDINAVALCLSAGFFFAEITIGPMWAIPMDIAPRYSGTAAGSDEHGLGLRGDRLAARRRLRHRRDRQLVSSIPDVHRSCSHLAPCPASSCIPNSPSTKTRARRRRVSASPSLNSIGRIEQPGIFLPDPASSGHVQPDTAGLRSACSNPPHMRRGRTACAVGSSRFTPSSPP